MKIKPILAIVGTALIVNGCAMIPKYTRPKTAVPDVLPTGDAYSFSQEGASLAEVKWQDIILDAKLKQVIELAQLNNIDLKLAVLNVERAQGLYGVQRGELFPALSASAAGTKQRVPADLSATGKATDVAQYSVNFGISAWEIDLFGRLRSLKEQALQQYFATDQARRATLTALISETAKVYLVLAADLEKLKLAENTLKNQQDVYAMMEQQFNKGLIAETDLRRSQTQVDGAKGEIARYTQLVAQDRNALNLLCGCSVPEELLPSDLSGVDELGAVAPGISSDVLLRRPDVSAAEHQLKAANAFIGAARAAFFPRISLTTVLGTASAELSGLFASGSNTWSFVPQAAMPIFDFRVRAAYRVSKATRDIALAQYNKSIQTAFREVSDALAVRGTVDQQVAAQQSVVASMQKIYDLSEQRYKQGVDGYLSVLDAQRSLYSAQQALTTLRLAKMANQVSLYAVLGGDE